MLTAAVAGVRAELPTQFRDLLLLVRRPLAPLRSSFRSAGPAACSPGGRCGPEEARSRRDLGTLALKDFGMRTLVIGASGPSTSWVPIRRSWLSRVITAGRGSREWWSELRTTASLGVRPVGTSTTSPGRSLAEESSVVTVFLARGTGLGGVLLDVGERPPDPRSTRRSRRGGTSSPWRSRPATPPGSAHLAGQPHHGPVSLELGEGGLKDRPGPLLAELRHQVEAHVVGGPEAGVQRVRAARGEAGDAAGSVPGCQSTTACPSTSMPRRRGR